MANRVVKHLPEFYRDIQDFRELDVTVSEELNNIDSAINQLLDNRFVMTSSVEAIERREKIRRINADPNVESLEFRRLRILNRNQTKPPFTIRYLQQQLDRLVGVGMTIVTVNSQQFIISVMTNIENALLFREVHYTINIVKPANMLYQQSTSLGEKIGFKESISRKSVTWNYKLGSWKVGEKPFATLGSEVVIK
ncbi:putative phage tail protein [Paenibacillus sp. L3-i20]|uniref:putative phage tail protein n=1 Tax=Paenibacillus sp. L3-i20 TaxID=2905833 RepID=UPI001EDDC475|nr:putative phage tail protein [Paenibacillus sp. L3-i20]GKU79848.1 phage portal protein [Paenibacillus sp. L3-i20]